MVSNVNNFNNQNIFHVHGLVVINRKIKLEIFFTFTFAAFHTKTRYFETIKMAVRKFAGNLILVVSTILSFCKWHRKSEGPLDFAGTLNFCLSAREAVQM
jgi:hypothetical protein